MLTRFADRLMFWSGLTFGLWLGLKVLGLA
jgi:hypothetical protein